MNRLAVLAILSVAGLVGCSSAEPASGPTPSAASFIATPSTTSSNDVMASPTIEGSFSVLAGHLSMRCFGTGAPAIILLAGDDSGGNVFSSSFIRPLAQKRMTCVYDRLGTGNSDPPSAPRRVISQVAADVDQLLAAAKVPTPVVLVGSSGGGNIALQYASRHPKSVAGLGLLDVGAPEPDLGKEFPGELAWKNPEHIDWVEGELQGAKLKLPLGNMPVLVVVAARGQNDPNAPSYWLKSSSDATQVVVEGGHDVYQDNPDEVARQVLAKLT